MYVLWAASSSGQRTPTLYTSAKYKTLSDKMSVQVFTEQKTLENNQPLREKGDQELVQDHGLATSSFSGLETIGHSLQNLYLHLIKQVYEDPSLTGKDICVYTPDLSKP